MPHPLIAKLAAYLRRRPNVWIDGVEIAGIAGRYAWRSRISDLRRPPWSMRIDNRQRRMKTAGGDVVIVSEYRLVVAEQQDLPLAPLDAAHGEPR